MYSSVLCSLSGSLSIFDSHGLGIYLELSYTYVHFSREFPSMGSDHQYNCLLHTIALKCD